MNRQILRLAIPNIITNITVPLLGMVDTAIVGHIDLQERMDFIGAVAIGNKMHIVVVQFCPRKQWTDGHTPGSRSVGEHDGAGHRRRSSLLRGKIKK